MTQAEIKKLASEIVGDGESPNKFFVTVSPYFKMQMWDGQQDDKVLDGFDAERDMETYGPFDTLEEAQDSYDDQDLNADYGVGSVCIEDRETGTVKEKFLVGHKEIVYTESEY
jgi:hypothetical protein